MKDKPLTLRQVSKILSIPEKEIIYLASCGVIAHMCFVHSPCTHCQCVRCPVDTSVHRACLGGDTWFNCSQAPS